AASLSSGPSVESSAALGVFGSRAAEVAPAAEGVLEVEAVAEAASAASSEAGAFGGGWVAAGAAAELKRLCAELATVDTAVVALEDARIARNAKLSWSRFFEGVDSDCEGTVSDCEDDSCISETIHYESDSDTPSSSYVLDWQYFL
ncbi:unnamed protein product, partial [Polarella glacialis]